jgi:hypothetical protein
MEIFRTRQRISLALIPTCLFGNAVQRSRCEIIAWISRNRDTSRLLCVFELAMAPASGVQVPTILTQHAKYLRSLHSSKLLSWFEVRNAGA